MARVGTSNLNLGMWRQGENPGAGSQAADNNFLNGNWWKLDVALGAAHDTAGNHKAGVIHNDDLNSDCVDASTLTFTGGKLAVKDDGVDGIKLKYTIVDDATLGYSVQTGAKVFRIKDNGVTGIKLNSNVVDASTLQLTSNQLSIKDAGVTAAKISHDNNRTKAYLTFRWDNGGGGALGRTYVDDLKVDSTDTSYGYPMLRAGAVTGLASCESSGLVTQKTKAYAAAGNSHFVAGDRISITTIDSATNTHDATINGNSCDTTNLRISRSFGADALLIIEIEFD